MTDIAPLVVTAGEPAGIGPDLCIALASHPLATRCIFIGDPEVLRVRAKAIAVDCPIHEIEDGDIGSEPDTRGGLRVLAQHFPNQVQSGQPDAANSETLLEGLQSAVRGCLDGRFSALVTAPLQKSTINDAGTGFSGHTEYLAELTGTAMPVMLLVAGSLRVALASTHLPLRDVPDVITSAHLNTVLDVLYDGLRTRFLIERPDIVVCGLNPHAGEGGHLGSEDDEIIRPVVEAWASRGVRGPLPADTAFTPAAGNPDAVLAMYHDQGLPVLKHAGFGHAVNVTLGLPIIRTSVDHGTALDLVGTGKADAGSLIAAVELAAKLAQCK